MSRALSVFLLLTAPAFLGSAWGETRRLPEGIWHDGWITLRPGYQTTKRLRAVLHNRGKDAIIVQRLGTNVPATLLTKGEHAWIDAGPGYCGNVDWEQRWVAAGDSLEFEVLPNTMLSELTLEHVEEYRVALSLRHSLDGTWVHAVSRQSFRFPRR